MLIFPKPFLFLMPINDKINTNYFVGQTRKKKKVKNVRIQYKKGNVNECCTALVKNLIKESFYEKR